MAYWKVKYFQHSQHYKLRQNIKTMFSMIKDWGWSTVRLEKRKQALISAVSTPASICYRPRPRRREPDIDWDCK